MFGDSSAGGELGYNGFPISLNYFTALPDPNHLHDGNATIIFKSLLKKDAITKEKSLNDLVKFIDNESSGGVEDLLIISWLQMYPKLAIDDSRNVRLLAHQVQAKLLEKVGGKGFSKYFKSSIPIWLLGVMDADKTVADQTFKGLVAGFQNDSTKVQCKVWEIFYEQIINFIVTVVTMETHETLSDARYTKKEDSVAKYDRVLTGAINMTTRLILVSGKESLDVSGLEPVLFRDELWDRLNGCLDVKTLNTSLFKAFMTLISVLFERGGPVFDMKLLYKLVLKKFLKHVKFPLSKGTNTIIYSSVIDQFWFTLRDLTQYSQKNPKMKKNFWEYGTSESKSLSRFMSYLKLGSCQRNHRYYLTVRLYIDLLTQIDACKFLIEGKKNIKEILKYMSTFSSGMFDDRKESLSNVLQVYQTLRQQLGEEDQIEVLASICLQVIRSPLMSKPGPSGKTDEILFALSRELGPALVPFKSIREAIFLPLNKQLLAKCLEQGSDEEDIFKESYSIDSYIHLLVDSSSFDLGANLADEIVEGVAESPSLQPSLAFNVLAKLIPHLSEPLLEPVQDFLETLPSYLESDFVEGPLALINKTILKVCSEEMIGDFFAKLLIVSPAQVPNFLVLIMDSFDLRSNSEIMEYIKDLSASDHEYTKDEDRLVLRYFNDYDDQIFSNLLVRAKNSNSDGIKFLEALTKNGKLKGFGDMNFIFSLCWKNTRNPTCKTVLLEGDKAKLSHSLFDIITTDIDVIDSSLFGDIAEFIFNNNLITLLPYNDIVSLITSSPIDIGLLSIANPLEQNIYLAPASVGVATSVEVIVSIGKFLLVLSERVSNDRLSVCVGLVSEYLTDVSFTSVQKQGDVVDSISELQMQLLDIFENKSAQTIETVFGTEGLVGLVDEQSVYFTRLYKRIVSKALANTTVQEFESVTLDLSKLANTSPLKLAAILMSCTKFFTLTTKFDRIRNFVFAEILGVRGESKILTDGLKWVALSINFLDVDIEDSQLYIPVPPPRLMMVVNTFTQFLDSSIAYDEEFIVIRCLLARFFIGYLKFATSDTPMKLFDLAFQVLQDNLATIQTEPKNFQLRYFTLKLFIALKHSRKLYEELWTENELTLIEEVVEVLVNEEIQAIDIYSRNQSVALCHEVLVRIFSRVDQFSIGLLNSKIEKLYVLLKSEFIDLQRIATKLLHKLILTNQQEFVIEYQLRKKSIDETTNSDLDVAKLPSSLLSLMSVVPFEDYLEFESPSLTALYLWSWSLVFDHFEDITYSIRNEYTDQLKQLGSIEILLDFIFQQVDVSDDKLVGKLLGNLTTPSFEAWIGESILTEMKLTLIQLYYLALEHFGSEASLWYNGIRDRQLKSKIEKFTTKYVSSILINQILDDVVKTVDAKKGGDGTDEQIMTLKVNKTTNEIRSIYAIDDQTMEMIVKIPELYPLHKVTVEGPLRLGVKENQWKAWLLASQRVISLTNGSISEAVELFNRNVNLHFSGFEDCAICYSILHQDHSLPSKNCPVCSNKFHAACLYKWFKSSGSSTCPLCRSTFNFSRRS